MRFDIVTIFPEMFVGPLATGVVGRGSESGLLDIRVQDLRDFADPPRRNVDDQPFGGGAGMVLTPEPLFRAVDAVRQNSNKRFILVEIRQHCCYVLRTFYFTIYAREKYDGIDASVYRNQSWREIYLHIEVSTES